MTALVLSWLSFKAPAPKLEVLSGDVRHVCGVWRPQCPSSIPLQPSIQVIASPLLFHPVPQLLQVHLVHSQVQGTVHLWTQEERIQNTLQNTLAPWCGSKPRRVSQLNITTALSRTHSHTHTHTNLQKTFSWEHCRNTSKNILFIIKYYKHKK